MVQLFTLDPKVQDAVDGDVPIKAARAKSCLRRSQTFGSRPLTKSSKPPSENEHYLTIYLASDGKPQIISSASLKPFRGYIADLDTIDRFSQCVNEARGEALDSPNQLAGQKKVSDVPPDFKTEDANLLVTSESSAGGSITPAFGRRAKRRRSGSATTPTSASSRTIGDKKGQSSEPLMDLSVADFEKCREYFYLGFQAIQQIDCRFLAKRWIKRIEPKKQVHFPYNGGKQEPKHPEQSKPGWWPKGVMHKEPDHINKNDRLKLLVHLLTCTGTQTLRGYSPNDADAETVLVQDLFDATQPHVSELKNKKSWSILQEMFNVRKHMERLNDGCCDKSITVHVADRTLESRRGQGDVEQEDERVTTEESWSGDKVLGGDEEGQENGEIKPTLTPQSSTLSSPVISMHNSHEPPIPSISQSNRSTFDRVYPPLQPSGEDYAPQSQEAVELSERKPDVLQMNLPFHTSAFSTNGHQYPHDGYGHIRRPSPGASHGLPLLATHQGMSQIPYWPISAPAYHSHTYFGDVRHLTPLHNLPSQHFQHDHPYNTYQQIPSHGFQESMEVPPPVFQEPRDLATPRTVPFSASSEDQIQLEPHDELEAVRLGDPYHYRNIEMQTVPY